MFVSSLGKKDREQTCMQVQFFQHFGVTMEQYLNLAPFSPPTLVSAFER